jgi:rRNA processing protein Gar1
MDALVRVKRNLQDKKCQHRLYVAKKKKRKRERKKKKREAYH